MKQKTYFFMVSSQKSPAPNIFGLSICMYDTYMSRKMQNVEWIEMSQTYCKHSFNRLCTSQIKYISEYTNGNAQIILHAMYLVNIDEF